MKTNLFKISPNIKFPNIIACSFNQYITEKHIYVIFFRKKGLKGIIPVCRACQDFFDLQTAFKKGKSEGIPKDEATTAKALAVVLRTYSSILSISGLMVEIIVANPAALAKLEIISRPSTLA